MAGTEEIAVVIAPLEFPESPVSCKPDPTKPPPSKRRYVFFYFIVQIHWRPTKSLQYVREDEREISHLKK
ncbi:unnamed protein product [Adineta steineri]|uniref:Uncharacterized protein n=1 Tax=Adineta steineri TaxID=433720 RepID=A0A814FXY4_9BILA|nr:unnamed protein product [Adineta steineri]CAF0989029.1 unnamed protein product [Adineta steineri]